MFVDLENASCVSLKVSESEATRYEFGLISIQTNMKVDDWAEENKRLCVKDVERKGEHNSMKKFSMEQ